MSKTNFDVPVGTMVDYMDVKLLIEACDTCDNCFFEKVWCGQGQTPCGKDERKDNTNVIFKSLTNEQA